MRIRYTEASNTKRVVVADLKAETAADEIFLTALIKLLRNEIPGKVELTYNGQTRTFIDNTVESDSFKDSD